jgi:hypothetical protein
MGQPLNHLFQNDLAKCPVEKCPVMKSPVRDGIPCLFHAVARMVHVDDTYSLTDFQRHAKEHMERL